MSKTIGYKMMAMENGELCSLASDAYRFEAKIDTPISMDGDGVWLSTNRDFVIDNYSGLTDKDEVLVTVEFDSDKMTRGNLNDSEPVITVPDIIVRDIQKVEDYEIKNSIKDFLSKLSNAEKKLNNFPSRLNQK